MYRLFSVLLAAVLLIGGFTVSAAEASIIPEDMALLQLGSAAEGSTLNYFVLRSVLQYCDDEGLMVGELFQGTVFSEPKDTNSKEKVMAFLDALTLESGVFSSAEIIVGDLKADKHYPQEHKYPLFVSFPNVSMFLNEQADIEEFCQYYIDTMVFAVNSKEYSHVNLAGVYFDSSYDGNESFRHYCMQLAKERGLVTIASTKGGEQIEADVIYAAQGDFTERIDASNCNGIELPFDGVPTNDDASHLSAFLDKAFALETCEKRLLFTFEAYNNIYDCAIALSQDEPNKNGRLAYECINNLLNDDYDTLREVNNALDKENDKKPNSANKNGDDNKLTLDIVIPVIIFIVCVLGIIYILVRKAKK